MEQHITRSFVVPGEPVPKGRPRLTHNGRVFTPAKTHAAEMRVKEAWKQTYGDERFPADTPLRISCVFYMQIPKTASRKRQDALDGTLVMKKPDCDNLLKTIMDGAQDAAFEDDRQVCEVRAKKVWSNTPRTEVTIESIDQ